MNRGLLGGIKAATVARAHRGNSSAILPIALPMELDEDAARYVRLVEIADGQRLQPFIRSAINDLVIGLKADRVWWNIRAAVLLAGPRTLAGINVPLVGPWPRFFNFIPSSYSQTGGLTGLAAANRTIDSCFPNNGVPISDFHLAMWLTGTPNATHVGYANVETGGSAIGTSATNVNYRCRTAGNVQVPGNFGGFYGMSRNNDATFVARNGGISRTLSANVDGVSGRGSFRIFGNISYSGTVSASSSGFKFYSIGHNTDLAKLERRLERYNAAILGAPVVRHPEAQWWIDRAYRNFGTVAGWIAEAANTYANTVDAFGIRDRFYRHNLMTGDQLAAALVPFYLGPVAGGPVYGGLVETNVGFVNADFSPTIGATGNGTTKYWQTGLTPDDIAAEFPGCHLSAYKTTSTNSGALVGTRFSHSTDGAQTQIFELGGGGNVLGSLNGAFGPPGTHDSLISVLRQSSTSLYSARNASKSAVIATATTPAGTTQPFTVFCRNIVIGTTPGTGYAPNLYTNQTLAGYSIGGGLTDQNLSDYNDAIQAFQASHGRAVA